MGLLFDDPDVAPSARRCGVGRAEGNCLNVGGAFAPVCVTMTAAVDGTFALFTGENEQL